MKRAFLIAAAVLALGGTARAQVPADKAPQVLNTWYEHYLGRPIPQEGMDFWYPRITTEATAHVLGAIVGSDEYYNHNGATPEGFVRGLYRDVLGRTTDVQPGEVGIWLKKLADNGGKRDVTAEQFMTGVDILNPPVPQVAPAAPVAPQVLPPAPPVAPQVLVPAPSAPEDFGMWSPYRYVLPPRPYHSPWSVHRYAVPVRRYGHHEKHERHDGRGR